MQPPALCVCLAVNVLMLLADLNSAQETDAVIVPSQLQLFEYTSVSVTCEGVSGSPGWAVMRQVKGKVSPCVSTWATAPASICAIKPVYPTDSGEYWCQAGERSSNVVSIIVSAGAVILESPARPVTEGDSVTLSCRSRTASSALVASFYKDGVLLGSRSSGQMTIRGVSKASEGLYKCSVSELGESPQSWLAVRAVLRETRPSSDHSCHVYLVLRTVFTVFLVALLLLLVGLLHHGKLRVTQKVTVTRPHVEVSAEVKETTENTQFNE